MKTTDLPLSAPITTGTSQSRGNMESRTRSEHETPRHSSSDGTESVTISIVSSSGFEDSETFTLRGKKAANAFARRVMSASIRTYDRRDDDAE